MTKMLKSWWFGKLLQVLAGEMIQNAKNVINSNNE